MKIKWIKVPEYMGLLPRKITFTEYNSAIYNNQILLLIGQNGSGKTSLCSFIYWLFRFLSSDISNNSAKKALMKEWGIAYELKGVEIEISSKNKLIEAKVGKDKVTGISKIRRNDAIHPSRVVVSAAPISSEFPKKDVNNGRFKTINNSCLYLNHNKGFPSITKGIAMLLSNKKLADMLFTNLGIKRTGRYFLGFRDAINQDVKLDIITNVSDNLQKKNGWTDESGLKWIMKNYGLEWNNNVYVNDVEFIRNKKIFKMSQLSSGEKFFIYKFLSILSSVTNDAICIIEEPEVHLNPSWIELFIPLLNEIFNDKNVSLIVTTHSLNMLRYLTKNQVVVMNNGVGEMCKENTLLADSYDFKKVLSNENYVDDYFRRLILHGDSELLREVFENTNDIMVKKSIEIRL